jgi:hypothetical protein
VGSEAPFHQPCYGKGLDTPSFTMAIVLVYRGVGCADIPVLIGRKLLMLDKKLK